jgi:hypothetical protein
MTKIQHRAARLFGAAGFAAVLCSGLAYPLTGAAEEAAPPAHDSTRASMEQRLSQHLQAHLDQLAARLEIKASQEPAWQAFSASFRELMTPVRPAGKTDEKSGRMAELDAAAMAREQADRAAEHAQKLARLADATAKLEQVLGNDQRQVLNEAARHFAHEHAAHSWMARGEFRGRHGAHCDHEREHDDQAHGRWEHGDMREDGGARDGMPR